MLKSIEDCFIKHMDRIPNSENHNPDKKYIRALIHRIFFLRKINKKRIAELCGISLSSIDKYTAYKNKNAQECPYYIQYLLEDLAGIKSKGNLFKLVCETEKGTDIYNFIELNDDWGSNNFRSIPGRLKVHAIVALDSDEIDGFSCYLKFQKIEHVITPA